MVIATSPRTAPMVKQVLDALAREKLELPPRPEVTAEILQCTNDAGVGSHRLTQIVQGDPALSARIIQLANSSGWRGRRRIESLSQAIARLGVRTLRETVLSFDLSRVYRAPGFELMAAEVWHHALATGLWAREISRRTKEHADLSYVCGLLHSMGTAAALYQAAGLCRARRWTISVDEMVEVVANQRDIAGVMLSREWDLPDPVRAAITWVDTPSSARRHEDLVWTISLAAQLGRDVVVGEPVVVESGDPLARSLGLSHADLEALMEAQDRVKEAMAAMLR